MRRHSIAALVAAAASAPMATIEPFAPYDGEGSFVDEAERMAPELSWRDEQRKYLAGQPNLLSTVRASEKGRSFDESTARYEAAQAKRARKAERSRR